MSSRLLAFVPSSATCLFFTVLLSSAAYELDFDDDSDTNGGVFSHGRCHCIHPHKGETCQDFICSSHGMSVGKRFDPKSLFFNRPCICDQGWTGDLCELHPSEKCNNRGEWKKDHCECTGFFFGPTCAYTSKCVMGKTIHGRCLCFDEWEGDYCHKIICRHGYADIKNKSLSCICPKRYDGLHCDRCRDVGKPVSAYPECGEIKKKKILRPPRKQTTSTNNHRLAVITGSIFFLILAVVLMGCLTWKLSVSISTRRKRLLRERELKERQAILEEAAITMDPKPPMEEPAQDNSLGGRLRRSLRRKSSIGANLFNLSLRINRFSRAEGPSSPTIEVSPIPGLSHAEQPLSRTTQAASL